MRRRARVAATELAFVEEARNADFDRRVAAVRRAHRDGHGIARVRREKTVERAVAAGVDAAVCTAPVGERVARDAEVRMLNVDVDLEVVRRGSTGAAEVD